MSPLCCLPWGGFGQRDGLVDPEGNLQTALAQLQVGSPMLAMTDQYLGEEAGSDLAAALANSKEIKVLQLNGCGLGDAAAAALGQALAANRSLTALDLDFNSIGDVGLSHLCAHGLKADGNIREFHVTDNEISSKGMACLSGALRCNATLQYLCLAGNRMGDEGISVLGSALPHNHVLESLVLERNDICDPGAVQLAAGVSNNSGLKELSLGSNWIADQGAIALAAMLMVNGVLQEVHLDRNAVSDHGAQAIAEALPSNGTLRELSLMDNQLTSRSTWRFGAALLRNCSLQRLGLSTSQRKVDRSALRLMQRALRKRKDGVDQGEIKDLPLLVTPAAPAFGSGAVRQGVRRIGIRHVMDYLPKILPGGSREPSPATSLTGSLFGSPRSGKSCSRGRSASPWRSPRTARSPRMSRSPAQPPWRAGSPGSRGTPSFRFPAELGAPSPRAPPTPGQTPTRSPSPRGSPERSRPSKNSRGSGDSEGSGGRLRQMLARLTSAFAMEELQDTDPLVSQPFADVQIGARMSPRWTRGISPMQQDDAQEVVLNILPDEENSFSNVENAYASGAEESKHDSPWLHHFSADEEDVLRIPRKVQSVRQPPEQSTSSPDVLVTLRMQELSSSSELAGASEEMAAILDRRILRGPVAGLVREADEESRMSEWTSGRMSVDMDVVLYQSRVDSI